MSGLKKKRRLKFDGVKKPAVAIYSHKDLWQREKQAKSNCSWNTRLKT